MRLPTLLLGWLTCATLGAAPVIDGVLDDAEWSAAVWHDDFTQVCPAGVEEVSPVMRFAVFADGDAVRVAFAISGGGDGAQVEIYLAPDGTPDDFYRFVARRDSGGEAYFYSEAGTIQPDPFAPAWQHAVAVSSTGWTAEIAIPLSAFYMTRTASWKNVWRVNAVSARRNTDAFASWSPVTSLNQSSAFRTLGGFPDRPAGDDIRVSAVSATIDDVRAAGVAGRLAFTVTTAVGGAFDIAISSAETVRETLVAGDNKLSVPCTYPDRGRHDTHFALTRVSTGHVAERDYPVLVDFSTIDVKFTSPGYRNNFYPGQDATRIAGTVRLLRGGTGRLTLSGPGFATQTADVADDDAFSFDTTGFTVGTAALEVVSGVETNVFQVRRLANTGHLMTWIENGCLVTNGVPVVRRGIYAEGYMQGERFTRKLAGDRPSFRLTDALNGVEMSMDRLISGLEAVEGKRDVQPCAELYAAMDAKIEQSRGKNFGYYYINDEPECRSISAVYLKYAYDYIAEKDPYHVIAMASRGGLAYIDCADLFETHPYLNCRTLASGERAYGRAPNEIGDFISAFEPEKRLDKCVGFLPTAFAYRGQSIENDYPTFDEYELHCWAAGVRGARTLWPYAGHDLGDRPAVYEGCRYMFQNFEALQDYLLLGSRTNFVQNKSIEGALWTHGKRKLLVVCNFTAQPQSVPFGACVDGTFRAFRGTRQYSFSHGAPSEPVVLEPLETFVAITDGCDAGLDLRTDVVARVVAAETVRTTRDNRLLEEYKGVVFTSNMDGMGCYKLIDGIQDVLCRYSNWRTNAFVQMAFTTFTPAFRKVRVYGKGLDTMVVDIRKGGEWHRLTPVAARTETWMRELDFGVTNTTVKMRLTFPGPSGKRNYCELYEIELPRAGEDGGLDDGGTEAAEDEGVSLRWDAADCPTSNGYTTKAWYGAYPVSDAISTNVDGTFSIFTKTGSIARFMPFTAADRWLVLDFASFEDLPGNMYRQWSVYLRDFNPQGHGGTVTHPQAGIYVIPLQENHPTGLHLFNFYNYGLRTTFNHISLMACPANRIEAEELTGARLFRPKGRMRLTVTLAAPCEDLEVEMLKSYSSGDLKPFKINGTSVLELKCVDGGTGRVWRTEFDIASCESGDVRTVYARASVLGGALKHPLFSNFTKGFSSQPLADYVVKNTGVRTLSAPCEYLLLSNAVSGAGVKFDQASLGDEKRAPASSLRFTGFDAGAGARATFVGGWWDFGGGGFFTTNAVVGGRVTTLEGASVVTNVGLVAVAGTTGSDNALHITDAARLYAGKVVLGRSTKGGQRSRLTVTGGAHLSVAGAVGMSEGPTKSSPQLTGNLLRVADSNSWLRVGGNLTLGRQFSKAEAPGTDGYYGSVGGNTFELTDGARAEIGGALALDSSCRHGTSNRVVVAKGAWLKVNGVKLGNAWSSITSVKDHCRLEILDGAVVTNTDELLIGQYQNGNHTPMFVLVSNAVFHTDRPISSAGGLIKSPNSEIVVSGPRAVFRPGPFHDTNGTYRADRYAFGCHAKGSRIVVEDGAIIDLPLVCGYSYTGNSCQNTILVRSGATIRSTNIGMAGYGGSKDANFGISNRFVVASGSVVTSGIFRANSRWGVVTVDDAGLVLTNDRCFGSWGGLMLGCPNVDAYYAVGTNVVLELRGRHPSVRIPHGRLRAELASRIRFFLPATGFADPSEPVVYVKDLCFFDAATECGIDIVGAEDFYAYHKQKRGRGGRYVLIDTGTLTLSDAALAATQATLPPGVTLTRETIEGGRTTLALTVSPRAGDGLGDLFNGQVAEIAETGDPPGPALRVVLEGVVHNLPLAGEWTNFLNGAALAPETFNAMGLNGIPVWQSYVFGVDPRQNAPASEQLRVLIEIGADGRPVITCIPDQSENAAVRDVITYMTLGKSTLDAGSDWAPVTDENAGSMRFFKIRADVRWRK